MAGFFMLPRAVYARKQRLSPIGYKILLEIICKCRITAVAEEPIHFEDRRLGQSKLSFREQLRYLRHLGRLYRFKYRVF
jgi:dolichol-phosphate mannosyltransferase